MLVRFWGVRGSAPSPTIESSSYGGNTPCLEVRDEARGVTLIVDAGTGIVGLGQALAAGGGGRVTILLSHFHADHVQGLPFALPFFAPGPMPEIWAPALGSRSNVELFARSGARDQVPAPAVTFFEAGEHEIGGFRVRAMLLNHPGGAFAYRILGAADDLVYMTDHEFGNPEVDDLLPPFAVNSGATIFDALFTPDELPAHAGSGHATWQQGVEFASATGAGHLWLSHHKPGRTDVELAEIEARARRVYPASRVAREGDTFVL